MAKGDVTLKFDANTAEFIQKVVSARAALDDTAKKARETGEGFKKAGDHASEFAHKVGEGVKELAKLATIPTSIMGAVELTMRAVERRLELAEARAKALSVRSATFESAMFALGSQGQARELREQLAGLKVGNYGGWKPGEGEVESMFSQIVASVGPRATPQQFVAATRTGLLASGTGANIGQAVATGSAMAKLQTLMPGLSEEEADQLARFMQVNAPDVLQDDRILATIATAKNKMGAARFFAAGYKNFQGSRRIKPISDEVEKGRFTYDQILANPNRLPPGLRATVQAIMEGESALTPVGSSSEASRVAIAGGDDIRDAAIIAKNVDATEDDILEENASPDTINRKTAKRAEQIYRKAHPWSLVPSKVFDLPAITPSPGVYPRMGRGGFVTDPALSDTNQARYQAQQEIQAQLDELRKIREAVERDRPATMLNDRQEGKSGRE